MNIYLSGQKHFGYEVLRMLLREGHTVIGVSAPPLKDSGDHDRLYREASRLDLPLLNAGLLNAKTLPSGVDLIVCAHSHDYISAKTRARAKLGAIGYHPSLLPRHRGRDAVRWTIKMRDVVAGGSVFWLNDNVDGGPIAKQAWCWVRPGDDADALYRRDLQPMGLRLIKETLDDIAAGRLVQIDQDESLMTWEPSWEREPLLRPDLPQLGAAPMGYTVIKREPVTDDDLIGMY